MERDWLTFAGRRAYSEAVAVLQSLGESEEACQGALRRYASLVSDLDRAEERWRRSGREMVALGSKDQPVPSPWLAVLAQLRREIAALEADLGLTPASRAALGRRRGGQGSRGIGRAPDRQPHPRRPPERGPDGRIKLVTIDHGETA